MINNAVVQAAWHVLRLACRIASDVLLLLVCVLNLELAYLPIYFK
jgi:hypothetical protein